MTKAPLETVTGGIDVRMRITTTGLCGARYVLKVSHNAEIPLTIKTGPKTGAGQGSISVPPGKTWRYELGALSNGPYVLAAMEELSFDFSDGRNVNMYREMPCMVSYGLGFTGHSTSVSIV
mmetsp:Transcript_8851/g.14727  ORF Transcript_8851/g.14727 Transcript_8851/m.14727 type:complete len:121 (-) Transcript_8851:435-797(-)